MKVAKLLILVWDSHACKVSPVPDGLVVPADEEEVNFVVVLRLENGDFIVNGVQLPVAASFDCNLDSMSALCAYVDGVETYLHV